MHLNLGGTTHGLGFWTKYKGEGEMIITSTYHSLSPDCECNGPLLPELSPCDTVDSSFELWAKINPFSLKLLWPGTSLQQETSS